MYLKKLNFKKCNLAEGIYVNHKEWVFSWVDIINKKIFYAKRYYLSEKIFDYPFIPSNIFYCDSEKAIILDSHGISEFNWKSKKIKTIYLFDSKIIPDDFRANDGIMLSEDKFLFGTMHKNAPEKKPGAVWLLDKNKIYKICENYIPNFFERLNNFVFISDSHSKIIYKYSLESNKIIGNWLDLSNQKGNPDGGFFSTDQFCYLSCWGDSKIIKISLDGNIVNELKLPIKYPTSCKQLNDKIIITSASSPNYGFNQDQNNSNGYLFLTGLF